MNGPAMGIIHVHSDFSRDGLASPGELAEFARQMGFRFVALTDHAEDLSSDDMRDLLRQCEENSDGSCVLIPGLEFRCSGDIDILGLGISQGIPGEDPVVIASQIGAMGGVAVLAHPARNGYHCPPDLWSVLHGIEIWNAAYDGRFVPPLANLQIFQEARGYNPEISAFGGADLHWFDGPPGITIELLSKTHFPLEPEMVMDCLRSGKFTIRGKYFAFASRTVSHPMMRFPLIMCRIFYDLAKAIRETAMGRPEAKGA